MSNLLIHTTPNPYHPSLSLTVQGVTFLTLPEPPCLKLKSFCSATSL